MKKLLFFLFLIFVLKISPEKAYADTWISVSAGYSHTVGIKSDGTLWVWGEKSLGLLRATNTPIRVGEDNDWASVSAGSSYNVAIKTNGTLWAWGSNSNGRLGDGTSTNRPEPTRIGNETDWAIVSVGNSHSLAIKTNGTLWAWGSNEHGKLGDSTTTNRNSPVRIGTGTDWAVISAGDSHSLAVKTDGTLWAWGRFANGRLGDGSRTDRLEPTRIGNASDWAIVAAGGHHSLGIKTNGTLWAWGWNGFGQIGDGSTTDRLEPMRIGNASDWAFVAAGREHSFAIKTNGTLWAWGNNSNGRLGDGTLAHRNIPVRIGTATNWAYVTVNVSGSSGGSHSFATNTDSALWAWGRNREGQIGDGTNDERRTPVLIGFEGTTAVSVSDEVTAIYREALATRNPETIMRFINENRQREGFNSDAYLEVARLITQNNNIQLERIDDALTGLGFDRLTNIAQVTRAFDQNKVYYAEQLRVNQRIDAGIVVDTGFNDARQLILVRNVNNVSNWGGNNWILQSFIRYTGTTTLRRGDGSNIDVLTFTVLYQYRL